MVQKLLIDREQTKNNAITERLIHFPNFYYDRYRMNVQRDEKFEMIIPLDLLFMYHLW